MTRSSSAAAIVAEGEGDRAMHPCHGMGVDFHAALAIVGATLVVVALGAAALAGRAMTVAMLYLVLGAALGAVGALTPRLEHGWFLHLAELAVVCSLFASGLKVRAPPRAPALRAALALAGPGLVVTALGVAVGAHLALGTSWPQSLVLGAILAPTDPVLASEVSLRSADDRDALRGALTVEAGLNDGVAFPLVGLAALSLARGVDGGSFGEWALVSIAWAVPGGIAIGGAIGWLVGRIAFRARAKTGRVEGLDELLAAGVVALSYSLAEAVSAWGFLAVFATGVAIRRCELRIVSRMGFPPRPITPRLSAQAGAAAEALVEPRLSARVQEHPSVAAATVLRDTTRLAAALERAGEIAIVVCAGAMLASAFTPEGLLIALVLFFVARPLGVAISLAHAELPNATKLAIGWIGIRGAGTLFYASWLAHQGLLDGPAMRIAEIAITCVAASIVVHGATASPLLSWLERSAAIPTPRAPAP